MAPSFHVLNFSIAAATRLLEWEEELTVGEKSNTTSTNHRTKCVYVCAHVHTHV